MDTSSQDDLSRLMEVEARLEALLEEARADAARAVAAAEQTGRRAEAELDGELALLIRDSEERVASECESALVEIHAQSASAAARFESLDDSAVGGLARMAVGRLWGDGGSVAEGSV